MHTLADIRPGAKAVVLSLLGDGFILQRLLEMGLHDGAEIEVIRLAPLGDPMEIRVQGYHLSLRKAEAALVEVEPAP